MPGSYYPGPNPPDAVELRVLGSLIEKRRTTPDAYPLSVNSLRLACNQATNRDPVVDLDEHTILEALERLRRRGWTRLASGAGSRARKYRHLFDEALGLADPELALLCVLMLRGPQTPGELKQRTDRLHSFADLAALEESLDRLIDRELAARLPRRPGEKGQRYVQLLDGGESDDDAPAGAPTAVQPVAPAAASPPVAASVVQPGFATAADLPSAHGGSASDDARVDRLERELAEVRERLARLEDLLGA